MLRSDSMVPVLLLSNQFNSLCRLMHGLDWRMHLTRPAPAVITNLRVGRGLWGASMWRLDSWSKNLSYQHPHGQGVRRLTIVLGFTERSNKASSSSLTLLTQVQFHLVVPCTTCKRKNQINRNFPGRVLDSFSLQRQHIVLHPASSSVQVMGPKTCQMEWPWPLLGAPLKVKSMRLYDVELLVVGSRPGHD